MLVDFLDISILETRSKKSQGTGRRSVAIWASYFHLSVGIAFSDDRAEGLILFSRSVLYIEVVLSML